MVEEDKRSKLPANHEAKKRRAEWILQDEEKRKVRRAVINEGQGHDGIGYLHCQKSKL